MSRPTHASPLATARVQWIAQHPGALPAVMATAIITCRIETLAALRLQLKDQMVVNFPMEQRYFEFVRYSAMCQYLVKDVPYIVYAITELTAGNKESSVEAILVFGLVYGVLSLVVGYLAKAPEHQVESKALFSMTPNTTEWNGASDKEGVQTWDPPELDATEKSQYEAPVLDEDNIYESDGAEKRFCSRTEYATECTTRGARSPASSSAGDRR